MKTLILLTATIITAGQAHAYADDVYSETESSYERRVREIDNYGDYPRGGTDVVVPIPPSDRGVTYYGPSIMGSRVIRSPDRECLFTPQGSNCIAK